jgi:hypothetical protein
LAFRGDVLFTQRGTLGQVGFIPSDSKYDRYVVSQSQMKLTVDPSRVDARYVYQYFRLESTIQEILNRTITAGVPHINLGILKNFLIPLPPLPDQQAIAEIAQAYDDLIATNQRRIALLEDAARRLYREWFVHLRFPGHESVPVKDGVPEGWALIVALFEINVGFRPPEWQVQHRWRAAGVRINDFGVSTHVHNGPKRVGPECRDRSKRDVGAGAYVAKDFCL